MKLHLPKGLRAALLAVMTAGAAFTASTVQAADYNTGACTYKDLNIVQSEYWASYENGTNFDLENNKPSDGFQLTYMPDANLQDWTLTIDAYNVYPVIEGQEALGMNLFGTTGATVEDKTGKVTLNAKNSLALFITKDGDLRLATTGENQDILRNNLILGNVDRDWSKDIYDATVSLRVILDWDADGGQPYGNKNGFYGSLTLVGAYILSNESGHEILQEIDSHYLGQKIITNYEMPEDLFGWPPGNYPAYSVVGAGQVKASLRSEYNKNEDSWIPNATWVVSGRTSINGLLSGEYKDERKGGINRELGSYTVTNPYDSNETVSIHDTIHFMGTQGSLVLTEAIEDTSVSENTVAGVWERGGVYAGYTVPFDENEYQLTNSHPISYDIDPKGEHEVVAGFGAEKGLQLRVDIDVMQTTALSDGACGLSIVGEGTTILEIDNTGLQRFGTNLREDTPWTGEQGILEGELRNAGYKVEAFRFETLADSKGMFAIIDSSPERYLTFAETEKSNIILSPKGNGDVHLSLHASQIDKDSSIIMVDENPEKVTENRIINEPVMIPQLAWGAQSDISPGTPVFDANGNPIYKVKVGNEFENISTADYSKADFTGEYIKIDGVATEEKSPEVQIVYQKDTFGGNVEWTEEEKASWSEAEVAAGGKFYDVMKADGETVAFTIVLKYKPAMTEKILAVLNNGSSVVNNGVYDTKVVTQDVTRVVEVWRSKNEHNAIEKTVAESYNPQISSPGHEVYRAIDGTGVNMHIDLYSGAVDSTKSSAGYIENAVENGVIYVNGRKAVSGTAPDGSAVQVSGIMSTLNAVELKSAGSVWIDSHVNLEGDLTAAISIDISSGTTVAENVSVGTGSLFVGKSDIVRDPFDPHGATLVVRDTLDATMTVLNEGDGEDGEAVGVIPQVYIYGGAKVGTLKADNLVYVGTNEQGLDVTPEAWLMVDKAEAPEIRTPWLSIHGEGVEGAYTKQVLVSGTTAMYLDVTSSVKHSNFFKQSGRTCAETGMYVFTSEQIEAGTVIELRNENTMMIAGNIADSTLYLGDTTADDSLQSMVNNLKHESKSDSEYVAMSYTSTIATGKLSASRFIMPEGYSLSAAELEVTGELIAQAPEQETDELARTTPNTTTIFKDVKMKNAVVTGNSTTAKEIEAESISLSEGHLLSGAEISVETELHADDDSVLNNITLKKGELITEDDVTINNLKMAENTKFKTMGSASITNMVLSDASAFGGNSGQAFSSAGGAAEMIFDAKVDDSGNSMTLTRVVLDAANHDFGIQQQVEVLKVNDATASVTVADNVDIDFEVQPYTWASVKVEDGTLYLEGTKDEEGEKAKLVGDSEVREEIMDAFEEARTLNPGGELQKLNDAMGMVMKSSLESRQQILDALSGASITALADSQRRGVTDMQNNLRNRIIQMGGNPDWENSGIQAWAQADGSFSTTDSTEDTPGYDYTTWGATVGANIDLSETVTAGMSFSASYGEIESDYADRASGNNDAYYVSLFARHQTGRWTQMLILSAGQNDMDLERQVGGYTAEGQTDGSTFSAYYELGYTLGLNEEFTHIIQPIINARITSAKVSEYTETGSIGNAGLTYDGDSYTYGSVGIGLRYQGVLYESVHERNAVLEVRAQVTQDFGDATDTAMVAFASGTQHEVKGTDTTGTGFEIGAGLSIPVEMQTTVFADADVTVRPDYTGVRANIGLRYDF